MKTAIIILSDPVSGGEEALGRAFNGLAAAYDFKQRGEDVTVLFQGAGTRWIGELTKQDHPAHGLFEAVKDTVGGGEEARAEGFDLVSGNEFPGTMGLPSFGALISEGRTVLTF